MQGPGSNTASPACVDLLDGNTSQRVLAGVPAERGSQYILGVRVDATTYTAATGMIIEWAMRGESRYVIELPVNMVMEAYDCP